MTKKRVPTRGRPLVALLLFVISSTCLPAFGQRNPAQPVDEKPVQIATYNSRSGKVERFRKERLRAAFADGMQISDARVEKQGEKFYLIRKGNAGKVSRISRTPLTLSDDGALFIQVGGTTESCTGDPCSRCEFDNNGGCFCSYNQTGAMLGTCKHSISRSLDTVKSTN
jgi:hypothetical protein